MGQNDIKSFRRMCGQFRWLAVFVVIGAGGLLLLVYAVFPLMGVLAHHPSHNPYSAGFTIRQLPSLAYLFGVWSIGQAMGDIAKGRLIQPALAGALRRVGIALAFGGFASVFLTPNLMRLVRFPHPSYVHFDVPSMTLAVIGAALFLLSRVVDQASLVQAELDEMI
jgi:hypothetical protein